MIKVAIAGTNGFAQYLAHYLESTSPHQFIILSRRSNPGLTAKGWQIITTNYESFDDLRYLLTGVDVVISTISGAAQLLLIDAAAAAKVRRFVPSEFGGSPFLRSVDDIMDNGRAGALDRLQYHELMSSMHFTIFTCGVFYDRFAPGGLSAAQINIGGLMSGEGDYLVNFRKCRATVLYATSVSIEQAQQESVYICMTSARDAARFVVAAMDLQEWPQEFKFRGERVSLEELIATCEKVRNQPFERQSYTYSSMQTSLTYARALQDKSQEAQFSQLLATAESNFDFVDTNLNTLVDITCESFEEWLKEAWATAL